MVIFVIMVNLNILTETCQVCDLCLLIYNEERTLKTNHFLSISLLGKFPGAERHKKEIDSPLLHEESIKGTYLGGASRAAAR